MTGTAAAAVNFGSRIVFNFWVEFSTAVILAYLVGMVTAFILAKTFVFTDSTQATHKSAIFFTLVNLVAIIQTWGISIGLLYFGLPYLGITSFEKELAHAIGVAVPVFTSYLGHKHLSFR